ncbi:helix-turn-helix transcriptional regulator [Alkalihalobacillus sp. FSL W8-0930]
MALAPDRLKKLRKERKLSQEALGNHINVTKVSISGYERGERTPDVDTLNKLADFFGVTTDYLLGRVEEPDDIMNVAYSRGGHNFTKEEKEELDSILENEVEKFLRLRKQFLRSKDDNK